MHKKPMYEEDMYIYVVRGTCMCCVVRGTCMCCVVRGIYICCECVFALFFGAVLTLVLCLH